MISSGERQSMSDKNNTLNNKFLPKLKIDSFFISDQLRIILEETFVDRKLQNIEMAIIDGGIHSAIEKYRQNKSPDIILLEVDGELEEIKKFLDHLANYVDGDCKVFVFGSKNDILFYREIISTGVMDYIPLPVKSNYLIQIIINNVNNKNENIGSKVAACIGAVGGCGTSTLAQNICYVASKTLPKKPLLIDFDVFFSSCSSYINAPESNGLSRAFKSIDRLDSALLEKFIEKTAPFDILYDTDTDLLPEEIDLKSTNILLDMARAINPFIFIDMPHAWTKLNAEIVKYSDYILINSPPTLNGLKNTKVLLDLISSIRKNDNPPTLVFNQCGCYGRGEISKRDVKNILDLDEVFFIKDDPKLFTSAEADGVVASAKAGGNLFRKNIEIINERVFSLNTNLGSKRRKYFWNFLGRSR